MTQQTAQQPPLWRVLNEQRTQGRWYEMFGMLKATFETNGMRDGAYLGEMKYGDYKIHQANAQYTALAVNNLASLAEVVIELIDELNCYDLSKETPPVIQKAKEALNRIK